jgi:TonB family protein
MRSRILGILLVTLTVGPALFADATLRYKNDFKFGAILPPAVAQQITNSQKMPLSPTSVIQMKGSKTYTTVGMFTSVVDYDKQQITVIDVKNKQFAQVYLKDYMDQVASAMPAMPAVSDQAQKVLDSLKTNFASRNTGRTDTLLGIQIEENELTLTVQMTPPKDMPMPNAGIEPGQPQTIMKMVMQLWTATPDEVRRVPALTELANRAQNSGGYNSVTDPMASLKSLLGKLPGLGQGLTPMFEELTKKRSVMLRSHTEIHMPIMAQLGKAAQAQGKPLPEGFDANAPLCEMTTEALEVSSAPVDDAVFEVPSDYHATPLPALFKSMIPAVPSPTTSSSQPPSTPTESQFPKRIRIGGQVESARLISQTTPVYPEVAKKARIQGVVRLDAVINKDGTILELNVISGHPLLVKAAVDAVQQWRYQPTLLNGEAVEVATEIDVNFTFTE